ncbi:MAG TPA: AAA family ATPase [Ktedonobacterales bacterium]
MTALALAEVSFAARLKHERRLRGVSQEEMASRAGYTSAYISMLERGERAPTAATAELLAAALDLESTSRAALLAAAKRTRDQRAGPTGAPTPDPPLVIGGFLGAAPEGALVARTVELATLEGALASALRGAGRLVTVEGKPGVGKTRLAQEIALRARAGGAVVAVGRCYESLRAAPLAPFIEALSAVRAAASPTLRMAIAGRWPLLPRLLPADAASVGSTDSREWASAQATQEGPETQLRLLWQITAFVRAVAAERPVALLLDDLHWVDEASLQLLCHLARQTRDTPVLLVGAYRDTETGGQRPLRDALRDLRREGLLDTVGISDLDMPGVLALITEQLATRGTAGVPVSPDLVERLYEATGGLPLYLRGSVRVLLDRGDISVREGMWRLRATGALAMPESVRDAVGEQVARLSSTTQSALRAASALGQVFARVPLRHVSELSEAELDSALEEALLAGLIEEETQPGAYRAEYSFSHALTQRAIYEALPTPRRRQLHVAAGAALATLPEPQRTSRAAEIARHFLAGDDIAHALPHVLVACEYAARLCAWSEMERHAQLAAKLARELGDPASEALALERRGLPLMNMGRQDEALAAYSAASALHREAGNLDQLAWTTAWMVRANVSSGRTMEGLMALRTLIVSLAAVADEATPEAQGARFRALAFAPPAQPPNHSPDEWARLTERAARVISPRSAGRMYLSLSAYLRFLSRPDEAIAMAEPAIAFARQAADARVLLRSLAFYALALVTLGRLPEAIAALQETRDTGQAVDDLEAVILGASNLGIIYRMRGDLLRAREENAIALAAAERFETPEFAIEAPTEMALQAYYSGQWDDARRYLARAEEVARSFGISNSNTIMGIGGIVALATDNQEDLALQTRARLERVIEQAEHDGDTTLLWYVQPVFAENELLAGRPDSACARLRHLAELPGAETIEALPMFPTLAWAKAETGDLERAEALLADCVSRATAAGNNLALVDALRVRSLLAMRRERWQEAADAIEQSLALARPMPYPYAVAKTHYTCGLLHAARGAPELARARYTEALAILDTLGERPYAARVTEALGRLD